MNLKKNQPIKVEWIDASVCSNWDYENVTCFNPFPLITTLGFFCGKDDKKITLVHSLMVDDNGQQNYNMIPIRCVKKITVLKPGNFIKKPKLQQILVVNWFDTIKDKSWGNPPLKRDIPENITIGYLLHYNPKMGIKICATVDEYYAAKKYDKTGINNQFQIPIGMIKHIKTLK